MLTAISKFNHPSADLLFFSKEEKIGNMFLTLACRAHWNHQQNWLTNVDVCDWYGIHCERGEVSGLNFEANNLTGSCPPIILERPFLVELNLSNNDIEFSFEYIHMAKQLKQLHPTTNSKAPCQTKS
jgi:hypothetical protein